MTYLFVYFLRNFAHLIVDFLVVVVVVFKERKDGIHFESLKNLFKIRFVDYYDDGLKVFLFNS